MLPENQEHVPILKGSRPVNALVQQDNLSTADVKRKELLDQIRKITEGLELAMRSEAQAVRGSIYEKRSLLDRLRGRYYHSWTISEESSVVINKLKYKKKDNLTLPFELATKFKKSEGESDLAGSKFKCSDDGQVFNWSCQFKRLPFEIYDEFHNPLTTFMKAYCVSPHFDMDRSYPAESSCYIELGNLNGAKGLPYINFDRTVHQERGGHNGSRGFDWRFNYTFDPDMEGDLFKRKLEDWTIHALDMFKVSKGLTIPTELFLKILEGAISFSPLDFQAKPELSNTN